MENINDESVLMLILTENGNMYYPTLSNKLIQFNNENQEFEDDAFLPTVKNDNESFAFVDILNESYVNQVKEDEDNSFWRIMDQKSGYTFKLYDVNKNSFITQNPNYETVYMLTNSKRKVSLFYPAYKEELINLKDSLIVFFPVSNNQNQVTPKNFNQLIESLPLLFAKPIKKFTENFNLDGIRDTLLQPINDIKKEVRYEVSQAKRMFVWSYIILLLVIVIGFIIVIFYLHKISKK